MVEYVRGSKMDRWHWCENCTQYPMYIYEKTPAQPSTPQLCEQCKTKDENGSCQCGEVTQAKMRQLKRELAVFHETF